VLVLVELGMLMNADSSKQSGTKEYDGRSKLRNA